jgi:predicted exporter
MAFADVPAVAQLGTFAVAGVLGAAAATLSAALNRD